MPVGNNIGLAGKKNQCMNTSNNFCLGLTLSVLYCKSNGNQSSHQSMHLGSEFQFKRAVGFNLFGNVSNNAQYRTRMAYTL